MFQVLSHSCKSLERVDKGMEKVPVDGRERGAFERTDKGKKISTLIGMMTNNVKIMIAGVE